GGWEGGVGPCRWSLRASARPDAPLPTSPTPGTARGRRPDYVTPAPPPTVRGQGRLCRGRRSSLRTPPPTVRGRGRLGGGRRSSQMLRSDDVQDRLFDDSHLQRPLGGIRVELQRALLRSRHCPRV